MQSAVRWAEELPEGSSVMAELASGSNSRERVVSELKTAAVSTS